MERELQEEAGYRADRWDPLGAMLPCPGYSDEVIHLFLARELTRLETPPAGDDDEDMEVLLMEPAQLDAAIAETKSGMLAAAKELAFEQAASLRDRLKKLETARLLLS